MGQPLSESNIKKALQGHMLIGAGFTYDQIKDSTLRLCVSCQQGHMRANPRLKPSKRVYQPLEKIAVDYKGPFHTHSVHKNRGFYLISD
jgi:hypothetical protein